MSIKLQIQHFCLLNEKTKTETGIKVIYYCEILMRLQNIHNILILIILSISNFQQIKLMFEKSSRKLMGIFLIGLAIVTLSAVLALQIRASNDIDSQISNLTLLKDIRIQDWGQQPSPMNSLYTQDFTLYRHQLIDNHLLAKKSNYTKHFNYTYNFQNVSYTQGDSGRLKFINHWQLKQFPQSIQADPKIPILNLATDQIYNYDHYAPLQRKFTIAYNYLRDLLTDRFLNLFYTTYLHHYFFNNEEMVIKTVFAPLGFSETQAKLIYEDSTYGWSEVESFKPWVKLALQGPTQSKYMPEYENLLERFSLTRSQMNGLLYHKSALNHMLLALNGTIKSKLLQSRSANYQCQNEYCSNEELVAVQLASGFLTNQHIFGSLNLNKTTKEMNETLNFDLEYSVFCAANPDLTCMPPSTMVSFFMAYHLASFEDCHVLWSNLNKPQFLEDYFQLPPGAGIGESLGKYFLYLAKQLVQKYGDHFSTSQTLYNNLADSLQTYERLFLTEIYSRGFSDYFLSGLPECSDYFTGQLSAYSSLCDTGNWDIVGGGLEVIRKYIQAYFYIDDARQTFYSETTMPEESIQIFFNDGNNSLFARQIQQLKDIFKYHYECQINGMECETKELFLRQWGSSEILSNLPSKVYKNKISNICEWDEKGVLNGYNPDYSAVMNETMSLQAVQQVFNSSSNKSFLSFFNLLRMGTGDKLLQYATKVTNQVSFQGMVLKGIPASSLFEGFTWPSILKKKNLSAESGGSPWMSEQVYLTNTDNNRQIHENQLLEIPQFNQINTGIYEPQQLRKITSIWGATKSGSKYIVYKGTKKVDNETMPINIFEQYQTDKTVVGNNLLGFMPSLQPDQSISIYLRQAYQSIGLQFQNQQQIKIKNSDNQEIEITVYRYSIRNQDRNVYVGVEELNQNSLSIATTSYFLVEPVTGLTLEFQIDYQVLSSPLFVKYSSVSEQKVPLYDSVIKFRRVQTKDIAALSQSLIHKKTILIVGLIAMSVFLVLGVFMCVAFCRAKSEKDIETPLFEDGYVGFQQ